MTRKYVTEPKRWISKQELVDMIKEKEIEAKMVERLYFIKYLYEGDSVPEAIEKVEISLDTGYRWRDSWNEDGPEGLIPNYDGGPKPKLSEDDKEELKDILEERNNWTTREIKNLIEDKFGVDYTMRHVRRLLKSMGMKHGKPYQKDYRKPDDSEERLKKTG